MSFLLYSSTPERSRGLMVYDVDPEWEVGPVVSDNSSIFLTCSNAEGDGRQLFFDLNRGLWGAILRRDDTPYNDCLPPSESILLQASQQASSVEKGLEKAKKIADEGFYNPFNLLLGSLESGTAAVLEQSFQSETTKLAPGPHLLEDEGLVDKPSEETLQPFLQDLPEANELEELAKSNHPELDVEPSVKEGMRETRFAAVFSASTESVEWSYTVGFPPESEWKQCRVRTDS